MKHALGQSAAPPFCPPVGSGNASQTSLGLNVHVRASRLPRGKPQGSGRHATRLCAPQLRVQKSQKFNARRVTSSSAACALRGRPNFGHPN
eukprot:358091-Chlamydomonas_euryale.AAC.5